MTNAQKQHTVIHPQQLVLRQTLESRIRRLLQHRFERHDALEQILVIDRLAQSLPLAADQFATVKCRLKNAHRYLRSDERGAARYELRLLLGVLAGE